MIFGIISLMTLMTLIGLQVVSDAPGPQEPKTVLRVKEDQVYNSVSNRVSRQLNQAAMP